MRHAMGRRWCSLLSALAVCFVVFGPAAKAATRHPDVASLNSNSQEVFAAAMERGDRAWDSASGLERAPLPTGADVHAQELAGHRMVKESIWYALGLLLRDAPRDRDRSATAIRAVLHEQY